MIENIESIRTELQILLAPCREVFEQRHVHAVISRPIDRIGSSAEQREYSGSVGNRRGKLKLIGLSGCRIDGTWRYTRRRYQRTRQRVLECTRVIPVGFVAYLCRATIRTANSRREGIGYLDRPGAAA